MDARDLLSSLPSVTKRSRASTERMAGKYPRRYVVDAIREAIAQRRKEILEGSSKEVSLESMAPDISFNVKRLASQASDP